jgi:hypothetical protein
MVEQTAPSHHQNERGYIDGSYLLQLLPNIKAGLNLIGGNLRFFN